MEERFIGNVGDPGMHDGSITAVRTLGQLVEVDVAGADGQLFQIRFGGVEAVAANDPVGMIVYALAELHSEPPLRMYSFTNWDESDSASLTITCRGCECSRVA
jgi:hypothetical protein